MIKTGIHRFFNALGFYTRIPCPNWVEYSAEQLNRATAYFPLMGYIVAAGCYGVFHLAQPWVSSEVAILISMVFGILLTGAFHEDGFADLCDGFGGGWTQDDILRIMKDSRLGTYGVIGLISMLALKWQLLLSLVPWLWISLLIAHSLSRTLAISLMMFLPYVQEDQQSKAKPIAQQWHGADIVMAWIWAIIPLAFIPTWIALTLVVIGLVNLVWIRDWYQKRLSGYTGDALGAAQQIQEICLYLGLAATLPLALANGGVGV